MKFKHRLSLIICSLFCAINYGTAAAEIVAPPAPALMSAASQRADAAMTSITEEDLQRFGAALEIIKRHYIKEISGQQLLDNALHGLLSGLDPHSNYLNAAELKDLQTFTRGQFSGLGLEVTPDDGYLKVITPLDDGPAQKAGVQAGDYIVKINDRLIKDMTLGEAIKQMRGPEGVKVILTLIRKDSPQPLTLSLRRAAIKVESVKYKMLEAGYGYIRIGDFQENTPAALATAIEKLKQQADNPLKGLILDLRNNPGGLLEPAIDVADDFLSARQVSAESLIVSIEGRSPGANLAIKAHPADKLPNVPLVVLINGGSASGAEIVAAALQDYKRAVLVGTPSFGKGSVQTVFPLAANEAIKLTTALYYTPKGRSIQAEGIQPDVNIKMMKVLGAKTQGDDGAIYIKEADLKGHLANTKALTASTLNTEALAMITPSSAKAELADADYQLFEGLNILKGLAAVQSNNH